MHLLADNIRRAAHGLHRCGWCGGYIAARERYRDARCADNGTAWTWRTHLACDAFMAKAYPDPWDWDDGLGPDDYARALAEQSAS